MVFKPRSMDDYESLQAFFEAQGLDYDEFIRLVEKGGNNTFIGKMIGRHRDRIREFKKRLIIEKEGKS